MKRLTRWMVRRFLPDTMLIKRTCTFEEWRAFFQPILEDAGYHIARNPAKGAERKSRKKEPSDG